MSNLNFDFDWVDPEGINGPELSATWASLKIQADDSIVTRVLDSRAKTVREFIHVPLYPLAEWLVTNWWFVTSEVQNPAKIGSPDFLRRHSLGANREGYAFPDLSVVPAGSRTHIAWEKYPSQWTRVEFLSYGQIWVDSDEFRETCADFVDQVIRRLSSLDIDGTLLQEEWDAIQTADKEESQFCEAAAGLGWDPYALDDDSRDCVLMLADNLGVLLDEAVPALDATDPITGSLAIVSAIEEAKLKVLPLERIESFRAEIGQDSRNGHNPWDAGYRWARRLRENLGLDGQPLSTMAQVGEVLGEDVESLDEVMRPVNFFTKAPLIDGVVTSQDESPAFAFRTLRDDARRFHFCRALAEVLASPYSDALITKAHSERQQRNRAFAAEFLAPSSSLRQRVLLPTIYGDDIDELAEEFGVSSRVIEHQITNHRIAHIGD